MLVMGLADNVLRRFQAGRRKHYKIDRRKLKGRNDPESWKEQGREYGFYTKYDIKVIPIKDIKVPPVWNPPRLEKAKEKILEGRKLDPIEVSKHGSKYEISDGIHRTNASIELGYTHVPAFVATTVETPELYEPPEPEKPQLQKGDWVKMRKPTFSGFTYGWVEEVLGPRILKGVTRYVYGLNFVDQQGGWDFGDYNDTEFDPLPHPPAWAIKAKEAR